MLPDKAKQAKILVLNIKTTGYYSELMKRSHWVWIILACLSGIAMSYPALSGLYFFKGSLLIMRVTQGVRFMGDSLFLVVFLLAIGAIGASLCLLGGTVMAISGRLRTVSRVFLLGTIFQWLFFAAILLFAKLQPTASHGQGLIIYSAITIIVSLATLQLRRQLRATRNPIP